jgi:N6-adenosine-specific RNA methylase IME4
MELDRNTLRRLPFALRVEIEENAARKNLTQSELAEVQARILAELRKHAKPGTRTDLTSEKSFPEVRATEIVGALFNESHRQVEKRIAVVEAAKANPATFGKLAADMDRTGRVDGPFKRLKVMKQAAVIRAEPPPYPNKGPYRVMVADPPWAYEPHQEDPSQRGVLPYLSMSIAQICAEASKVRAIVHDDCILWLWTTNFNMREAFAVLDAWGFTPKTILTWVKDKMGYGDWLRCQTEHCVMAVRGNPIVELTNQTTVLHGKVREHSRKPVEFYAFVERLCPAPRYAYLFSRTERKRWDCHGDEVGMFGVATPQIAADEDDRPAVAGLPDAPPPAT